MEICISKNWLGCLHSTSNTNYRQNKRDFRLQNMLKAFHAHKSIVITNRKLFLGPRGQALAKELAHGGATPLSQLCSASVRFFFGFASLHRIFRRLIRYANPTGNKSSTSNSFFALRPPGTKWNTTIAIPSEHGGNTGLKIKGPQNITKCETKYCPASCHDGISSAR